MTKRKNVSIMHTDLKEDGGDTPLCNAGKNFVIPRDTRTQRPQFEYVNEIFALLGCYADYIGS